MPSTYSISFSDKEDEGEPDDHFTTRAEAEARLAQVQATGRYARLLQWQNNQSLEVNRVNAPPGSRR